MSGMLFFETQCSVVLQFLAVVHISRVNCAEMAGNKPGQSV